jgi:pimeloyl-ACP methyl ester carboxylesterase
MAHKSRVLRHELELRNAPLAPWGKIRGTIFMLHGHRGCKEDHLPICERFCAAGFRCLLIDIPGHGQSPHPYATFGYRESEMIPAIWQEYQEQNPGHSTPLFLFGYSQGGAISLLTAAKHPEKIRAIASISAFSSLENPIAASAKHLPPVIRHLTPLTTRACAIGIYLRVGFFPSAIKPVRAARDISCPVFLCHGLNDSFVPPAQAQEIFDAIPTLEKTLKLIPTAKHHNTLSTGSTALYADICEHFLRAL